MNIPPLPAAPRHAVARGVVALPGGFALLEGSRALICADAHFGYEDVMGGALPLWSTTEIAATIAIAAQQHAVREIVFLGDLLHGSRMSAGATRAIQGALSLLRELAPLTFIAGNHEGRARDHRTRAPQRAPRGRCRDPRVSRGGSAGRRARAHAVFDRTRRALRRVHRCACAL